MELIQRLIEITGSTEIETIQRNNCIEVRVPFGNKFAVFGAAEISLQVCFGETFDAEETATDWPEELIDMLANYMEHKAVKKEYKDIIQQNRAIGDIGLPGVAQWEPKRGIVRRIHCVTLADGRKLAYKPHELWVDDVRKIDYDKYATYPETSCRIIPDDLIAREIEFRRGDEWLIPAADRYKYEHRVNGIAVRIVSRRNGNWVRCVAVNPKEKEGSESSDSDSFESYDEYWEGPVPADAYLAIIN